MIDFSEIDAIAIQRYLDGDSLTKISKDLKIDRGSLSNRMKKSGVNIIKDNNRKHCVDHSFFSDINTEEKAYWLGFLYADGYLSVADDEYFVVEVGLSRKDHGHLIKFLQALKSDYPIQQRKIVESESSRVRIYSKQIYSDLVKNGCYNNKSLNMGRPNILMHTHTELVRHFVRGYFDGDGGIGVQRHRSSTRAAIHCGDKNFLEWIKTVAEMDDQFTIKWDRTCYVLKSTKAESHRRFLAYIYDDSAIYLDRKYERYVKYALPFIKDAQ